MLNWPVLSLVFEKMSQKKRNGCLLRGMLAGMLVVLSGSISQAGIMATGNLTPPDISTWTPNGCGTIGYIADGTLTVDGGSDFSIDSVVLGENSGVTGAVTVSGSGSTWTCSRCLFIGHNGVGKFTIVNGGMLSTAECILGNFVGSKGTITVDGTDSTWLGSKGVCVGFEGTGAVRIINGGTGSNTGQVILTIGQNVGADGTMTVAGTGSTFTHSGYLYIGYWGNGTLNIIDGGKVIDNSGRSDIGYETGAVGRVRVEGTGSEWILTGGIEIGDAGGNGTLTILNGGRVVVGYPMASNLGSSGEIKIADGGQLALKGDADESFSAFRALIYGSGVMYGWDSGDSCWVDINQMTLGEDYTLTYQTSGELAGYTVLTVLGEPIGGDANLDGKVDVGDLGIMAANYGAENGAAWEMGDFTGDGAVDVGDLGILAANYGTGTSGAVYADDVAKVFGTAEAVEAEDVEEPTSWCSGLGLPLIAGLMIMGLMIIKPD